MSKRREISTAGGGVGAPLGRDQPAVALGAHRARPDQHRVGDGAQRRAASRGRPAPPSGRVRAVERRAAVERRDEVEEHVRPRRRPRSAPRSASASSSAAETGSPAGQALEHMAALDVVVDQPAGLHQRVGGRRADEAEARPS